MSVWLRSYLTLGLVGVLGCADADPSVSPETDDDTTTDEAATDEDDGETGDDEVSERVDASKPPRTDASVRKDAEVQPAPDAAAQKDAGNSDAAIADASSDAGTSDAGSMLAGECCDDGDCLCRGDAPNSLTSDKGQYKTASYTISTGTVHYPTDAEPPFAAVALCGGFTNTGPEMADWGPFYASHGIVTVITTTTGLDDPGTRGRKLLAAIAELKKEQDKSGSKLEGKLAGRYGTSGYSMGGGGTTIASVDDPTLKTSVGLAPWTPTGNGVKVPTLLLCGSSDTTAPCSMASGAYGQIPNDTPKMMVTISGASHFNWFGPTQAGRGTSGQMALAFQKVYLEGDTRWMDLLTSKPASATVMTNIQ
jgi:pimeloyl-ACP methyl ester carboxylesterase